MTRTRGLTAEQRFWRFVDKSNECWSWTGTTFKGGYGKFSLDGRKIQAHRFAWSMVHGRIPDGMVICHRCDNPSCVRLDHLFLGTISDNVNDALKKGRYYGRVYRGMSRCRKSPTGRNSKGENNPGARLNEKQVKEIRELFESHTMTGKQLGALYGVGKWQIYRIVRREQWKDV